MDLLLSILGIVLTLFGADVPATDVAKEPTSAVVEVSEVIDGDTVAVLLEGEEKRLRIIGIDTPETEYAPGGEECYATEATQAAKRLLDDQVVTIAPDPTQDRVDDYGRLLVTIELPSGEDFGEIMIAGGFAREFTFRIPHQNQAEYRAVEAKAQAEKLGLWGCAE